MYANERAVAATAAAVHAAEGLSVHRRRHAAAASRRLLAASGCFALACAIGVGVCLLRLSVAGASGGYSDGDGDKNVHAVAVSSATSQSVAAATRAGAAVRVGGGGGIGGLPFEGPDCYRQRVDGDGRTGAAGLGWLASLGRRRDVPLSDCRALWAGVADTAYLAHGWTKAVYSARYGGARVAVKAVSFEAHDMRTCLANGKDEADCYADVSAKLLREASVLRCLSHDNIIQLVGYCTPEAPDVSEPSSLAAIITELGEPLDLLKVLQMSWESRLRIALGIARLTDYFARYKLVLNDYKKEQFVLVNGTVKLADLDDVGRHEPNCSIDADCINHVAAFNFTLRSPCIRGACLGYNEKLNVINAGRHFMDVLLPYGTPVPLSDSVQSIVERYRTAAGGASTLLAEVTRLVMSYRTVRRAGNAPASDHRMLTTDGSGA